MSRAKFSFALSLVLGVLSLGSALTLWAQVTPSPTAVNFGSVAVGSPSTQVVSFTFGSSTTLSGVSAVTEGLAGLDYAVVGGGTTCSAATFSTSCTVEVQFQPLAPGSRLGALVLSGSGGTTLSTVPLFGVGAAAIVTFPPGIMSTVVGGDATGTPGVTYTNGVAVDAAGNVYAAGTYNNVIYKVTPAGVATTFAGGRGQGYSGDGGPATSAKLYFPTTIRFDGAGNAYIVDDGNNAVRMVNSAGVMTTVAGLAPGASICAQATDQFGDGCPATQASLDFADSYYGEGGTATDAAGNLYIGDTANNLIRVVSATTGIISIFAGTGSGGYSGDGGPAINAQVNNPDGGVFDGAGNFYFADLYNNVIRKITPAGVISTVVGTGASGHSGDGGPATHAQLSLPYQVAIDAAGDLYITDSGNFTEGDQNEVIRKVTPQGVISTVAGSVPSSSYGGDGGPATSANLWGPVDIAVDAKGNLYIADDYNAAIRKVDVSDPPPTLVFSAPFDTVSAPQVVPIINLGNTALTIDSVGQTTNFMTTASSCAAQANHSLPVAESCTVEVEFDAPLPAGNYTGTAVLTDNALNVNNATQTLSLQGASLLHVPYIAWATPAPITYSTGLSGTQLNASASYNGAKVYGTFTYSPLYGTKLAAGLQTLQVSFAPEYPNLFTPATDSVMLLVKQATPKITWAPKTITYPAALTASQLDATASVQGQLVYAQQLGTVLGAGSQKLSVSFTPADTADYTSTSAMATLTVNQATPVITWAAPKNITYPAPLTATQLDASTSLQGMLTYNPPLGTVLSVGKQQTLSVTFTPADAVDYKTVTKTVFITVVQQVVN